MEMVEGEDLAERLRRGAIPIDEAIAIAKQIAEGLEEAHEKGIVHRDLKPANVKLTPDGKVKILDFGLAKAYESTGAGSAPDMSHSPTMSRHMTEAGMIMGTAAYMSPEQARGKPVDKRADIWAFGVVLFEMLTGARLFTGETVSDVMASVLKGELNLDVLPSSTPVRLRLLIEHCLERDPKARLRDIGDVRFELDQRDQATTAGPPPNAASRIRTAVVSAAVALAIAGGVFYAGWRVGGTQAPRSAGVARFDLNLPPGLAVVEDARGSIAIAPDNLAIVIAARDDTSKRLYIRWLERTDFEAIPGTEDATDPFFSPDGRVVGFFSRGKLRKVSLANGTLSEVTGSEDSTGAAWAPDGTIVFAPGFSTGLARVAASGGEAQALTSRDVAGGEASHAWPDILPDGEHVLYTVEYTGKPFDEAATAVVSLKTGKSKILLRGATSARYSPSGHILYVQGRRLLAIPFDPRSLDVTGEGATVLENFVAETGRGRALFAMSSAGALAHVAGGVGEYPDTLLWATRDGIVTPASEWRRRLGNPTLSPVGGQMIASVRGAADDLWVLDLARGIPTRLTFGTENAWPVWAPDGKRFVWKSDRNGAFNLYLSSVDNPSTVERLTTSPSDQTPGSWTPDGGQIVYGEEGKTTRGDIWAIDINSRKPREIVKTAFDERLPALSPDGRWLAYVSDESGRLQVVVQPFPGPGPRRQVSDNVREPRPTRVARNGDPPLRWSRDGRELFYLNDDRLMAVAMRFEKGLDFDAPRALFARADIETFDIGSDGRRFLIQEIGKKASLTRISLALGAASEIGGPQRAQERR